MQGNLGGGQIPEQIKLPTLWTSHSGQAKPKAKLDTTKLLGEIRMLLLRPVALGAAPIVLAAPFAWDEQLAKGAGVGVGLSELLLSLCQP